MVQAGVTSMTMQDEGFGVINPVEMYTLRTFTRRLGIRASTLRSARRAGLRVYYVHKHAYIYGRDWIEYVQNSPDRRSQSPVVEAP